MSTPQSELDVVGTLAEAFLARYRRGERPSLTEYTEKYPELAEQIRELFPALIVMEELGSVEGPRPGTSGGTAPHERKVPEQLGDYRILREVGRGGMGIVYEAVQLSLGRHVALKVLSFHALLPTTHLERFRREARAAARLHHTNIVPVHGVGEYEGVHYYAMQFIQGQALDEVLKEVKRLRRREQPSAGENFGGDGDQPKSLAQGLLSGNLAPADASDRISEFRFGQVEPSERRASSSAAGSSCLPVSAEAATAPTSGGSASGAELTTQPDAQYFRSVAQMGMQVAAGLDYAHKQGVLHRDIKPSNLLLDARGTVWITDFGLAKAEDSDELTHTGDIVGTLRYMAPERLHGWSDPRSDVYGLGITLYEMLTLCPAFADSYRARLIELIKREDPPRPRKVDRSIPRDLETIILKAIDKEPGRRYPTSAELAQDLSRFLTGEPVRARRIGLWERSIKWVKRRPAAAALLAVSAVATLALVIGILAHNARLAAALKDAQLNLDKASRAEEQARLAEREKTLQLAIAHLREAQARRNSGLVGRRFDSLEAIKKAAAHFRALGALDEQRTLELRNETIACLLLADLKPGREWTTEAGWSPPTSFDPSLQHYAVHSAWSDNPENGAVPQGELSVRRISDDGEVARLPGFGTRAVETGFSPDGRYLAAHYEQGARHICVWDLHSRQAVLKVSQGTLPSFPAFSSDSRLVALARPDNSIRIYELPSGRTWADLSPGPAVSSVWFHPSGRQLVIVGGRSAQIREIPSGKEVAKFEHPGLVATLAWRSDGKVFATGCHDNDIYLWDSASPAQQLRILKGHRAAVTHLGFSHGGDLLLSDSWDSTCRLWDVRSGQLLVSKPGGLFCGFGPDDQELDHGWHVATGRECRTFPGHKSLNWLAVSPQGRLLASASGDGVRLWDLAAGREGEMELATIPAGSCVQARFDSSGESLITDGSAGLQRWPIAPDPETGGLRIGPPQSLGLSSRAPLLFSGYEPAFALSADGRTVAHSPQRGQTLLYALEDPRRKLLIQSPAQRFATFSPDGQWLATGNWQGRGVKIWNARTGTLEQTLEVGDAQQRAAWPAFSPDGKWLVTGTFAEYRFWEVGSWHKKHALPRENAAKSGGLIVFSSDARMLAVLHGVSEVRLVDPGTGRELARLPAAGGPYCFTHDGSQLVTLGERDGAFQIWDLRLIRRQLRELDLDWKQPPFAPAAGAARPLAVKVMAAVAAPPSAELDAQALLERGLLLVQMERHQEAWADFDRASRLDPGRPPWAEAARAYLQAAEQNPQGAEAYHLRAHANARMGLWAESIEDHSHAIERSPQSRSLLACRGKAYLHVAQKQRAAEDFRAAAQDQPAEANRLAWELATSPDPLLREPALAVELAEQATRLAPAEAAYWNTLGAAHFRLGAWLKAVKDLETAEKLAPGKQENGTAFFLAMCHQRLDDPTMAKAYLERGARWFQEHQATLTAAQRQELMRLRDETDRLMKAQKPEP
jgi:serine/threonine protein kinase/WD40 repeat protein/tetratricopeptide (TPR) repeat protein